MLSVTDGNLILKDEEIIINKNFTKEKFINSSLNNLVFNKFENSSWSNYSVKPQMIFGNEFGIRFTYDNSTLESITLITTEIKGIPFDEENEKRIKKLHDEWLEKIFGEPHEIGPYWNQYTFNWGEILSSLDPRAGQSEISIVYKK
jgi:hypothetical protein